MKNNSYFFNKNYVVNEEIIKMAKVNNLGFDEFILLVYFINSDSKKLDIDSIKNRFAISNKDVLAAINKLVEKNLISITSKKEETGKMGDFIELDLLELSIAKENNKKVKSSKQKDIFSAFEQEFGRTISSMEYEIINTWLDNGFTEDLILTALKEAVYNGVTNLRYIDKILFEWKKKGINTSDDVKDYLNKRKKSKDEIDLFDFDWLKDETK